MSLSKRVMKAKPKVQALACAIAVFGSAMTAEAQPRFSRAGQEVMQLEAEQARMLQELKQTLASMPADPPPRSDETPEIRQRREKRTQLIQLLAEIERRIAAEHGPRESIPEPVNAAYQAYYERLLDRIERGAKAQPPRDIRKLRGSVVLHISIGARGELEHVSAAGATSKELGDFIVALVRQLAPFESFSEEMRERVDHLEVTTTFEYGQR